MLAQDLFELRAALRGAGIIFAYSGYVTESVLTGVGEALKKKLTIDDLDTKTLRNVFAIFVEQMQNIIRYSAEKEPPGAVAVRDSPQEIRYGVITIGRAGSGIMVNAGNLILKDDVERLR